MLRVFDRGLVELEYFLIEKVFWQLFISISKICGEWKIFKAFLFHSKFCVCDLENRKMKKIIYFY